MHWGMCNMYLVIIEHQNKTEERVPFLVKRNALDFIKQKKTENVNNVFLALNLDYRKENQ